MNITFLVGNGFDIACGLHTSYNSFYESLLSGQTANLRVERLKLNLSKDKDYDKNDWSDFELWLGHYTEKYNTSLSEEFLETYDSIHDEMINYITEERNQFSDKLDSPEVIENLRKSLTNFPTELDSVPRELIEGLVGAEKVINYRFITFNYTDCIDLVVKELAKAPLFVQNDGNVTRRFVVKGDVLHVHGSLHEYPLLGVTEDKFIDNKEILSNTAIAEILLKEEGVKSVGRIWYRSARDLIRNSQIICIFGTSIGNSDSLWWKEIINWMKQSKSHHVIVYKHTIDAIGSSSIYRSNKAKRRIKDSLTCHSELNPQEKEDIWNRIQVVFNSKSMLQVPFGKKENL